MASIYTVWTTKGKAMATEQLGPNNSITFTRVTASSKDYSSTDPTTLAALTKLDSEQQKGYIAYSNIINPSTLHMELLFKNSDATKNYNLCTVGLYATGSDKQEYLYSVTVLRNPQVINTDSAGSTFGLSLNTIVGDAATVSVTITDAGAITQAILDAELANKVNVSDMRKPASDVAGIEEINSKQDKIGYTPANDSKVVHKTGTEEIADQKTFDIAPIDRTTGNPYITKDGVPKVDLNGYVIDNKDNTVTANSVTYDLSKSGLTSIGVVNSGSFNDLPLGTVFASLWMTDGPNNNYSFITTTFNSNAWGSSNKVQIAIANSTNLMYFRVYTGSNWNSWTLLSDDSKVVHNSGTEEIAGQKTFDTAPIDKTTGNPYITKDGVPSLPPDIARTGQANTFSPLQTFSQGIKTLQTGSYDDANSLVSEGLYYNTNSSIKNGAGSITTGYIQAMSGYGEIIRQIMYSDLDATLMYTRTSQDGGSSWSGWFQITTSYQIPTDIAHTGQSQTFTAAQTFSSAPTVLDTSSSKGDNQVALMGDLKSVEADAWHVAESSYPGLLMQVDRDDKIIYILSTGSPTATRVINGQNLSIICDLSSYIDRIVSASGFITIRNLSLNVGDQYTLGFTGAKLLVNARGDLILSGGGYSVSGDPSVLNNTSAFLKLQYNSWIGK